MRSRAAPYNFVASKKKRKISAEQVFVPHLKAKDWKGDIGEYEADCQPDCKHCCHGVEPQYNVFPTGAKDLDCNMEASVDN